MSSAVRAEQRQLVFFHDADVVDRSPSSLGRVADLVDVTVPPYPGFEDTFELLDRRWESWDSATDLAHYFRSGFADELAGGSLHLGGAGFGGWVALELALMSPRSLRSLVLVAPYGVKLFGRMDREFADVLLLDAHEQVELGWADPDRCQGLRMPGYPTDQADDEAELAFAERATLARYIWKPFLHSRGLSRWVHTIDTPTLIVAGSADAMLHDGHSRALAERMPNAKYVEIPEAGHYPYLERPDEFADVVAGFYSDLRG